MELQEGRDVEVVHQRNLDIQEMAQEMNELGELFQVRLPPS